MGRKKVATPRVMLVDVEGIIYSQCVNPDFLHEERNEKEEYWEVLDAAGVKDEIDMRIEQLEGILGCTSTILALGSRDNFRKRLEPGYKGNRKRKKPLGYWSIVEWCEEHWECLSVPGLEADDVLGVLHTHTEINGGAETVIVSNDKDLRTLPGLAYNWDQLEVLKPDLVTPEQAHKWLAMQSLMGDATDGYKGCPGVGKVKAEKAVDPVLGDALAVSDPDSYLFWHAVLPLYETAGLDEKQALTQARCARILRAADITIQKNGTWKHKLWTPSKKLK